MSEKPDTLTLPLLITRSPVLYPLNSRTIDVGREMCINAVNVSKDKADALLFVSSQNDYSIDNPNETQIYQIGLLARVAFSNSTGSGRLKIRVEAIKRAALSNIHYDNEDKCYVADGTLLDEVVVSAEKDRQMMLRFSTLINNNIKALDKLSKHLVNLIGMEGKALEIAYGICCQFDGSNQYKQSILESNDVDYICDNAEVLISSDKYKDEIDNSIEEKVRENAMKSQKDYFTREKIKALKDSLGEDDLGNNDPDKILQRLESNPYPEHIKTKVKSEIKKFQMMPQGSLEGALILSYLDVVMNLPWWEKTEDNNDLKNVEAILDEDHYGLENPKKRIVEYLAVKKLTGNLKSPILCFFGPPGTGKTSLGKSIARALGRKFFKCSLGGISDEAEIRGHRRTYVGSLPGRIIQGMRKAGTNNPVFLLDEVDKLASSYKGDPASALLEVLDPEQNFMFNDNYVEEPYDLSDVLFICTANYLENIPGPLRDRLELIQLSSYTEIEKKHIAFEHLIKKQIALNGLKEEQVSFTDEAITYILRYYTREAGVRDLERKIASCLRKVAVEVVKNPESEHIVIDEKKVREYLGPEIFDYGKKDKEKQVGVITGLAYTEYGGDILPIEVTYFKGKGGLVLTGKLGDVMKESATIALDYVKANAEKYQIDPKLFMENDIHIHVPEGAVPKDGPSAGVAITLAVISALSKKPASPDIALTGEVTLRGLALPIGGLKEKSLAAARSGIKTIIVPYENKKDVEELPKEVKEILKIEYMKCVDDAYKVFFGE